MKEQSYPTLSRRGFIGGTGSTVLSAAAVALLAGCSTNGAKDSPSGDVVILNTALGLEHEAINAYQIGAESKLLEKPLLDVAVLFQSHHKAHRDALIATIEKLGGNPVVAKKQSEYASQLGASGLKSSADVLRLAAKLELGATNAYLSVIPQLAGTDLRQVAGRLAADETAHWTILNNALGKALPAGALSFGV